MARIPKDKQISETTPASSPTGKWVPSDKKDFISDIQKGVKGECRFTLYHVGPDHTLIEDALVNRINGSKIVLFTDIDSYTVGFHETNVGNRIEKWVNPAGKNEIWYSFHVGHKEFQLVIY